MPESREFLGAGTVVLRGVLLCALLAAGCGGAGEARAPGDALAAGDGRRHGQAGATGDAPAGAGRPRTTAAATGGTGATRPSRRAARSPRPAPTHVDCKSGFCFDGVCCRSDCAGLCQSCALPGSVGTCMNAPVGTDPRNECPDDGIAGCMRDGTCDGTGACAVYARRRDLPRAERAPARR